MRKANNAQFNEMRHPFQTVTVPKTDAPVLRDYLIRYAIVESVDNQGADCRWCALEGHTVDCTVYVHDMDGNPQTAETCTACALVVVDQEIDTDPARLVLIERLAASTEA